MRFKFILAIALILCVFSIIPVNAALDLTYQAGDVYLGDISDTIITVYYQQYAPTGSIILNHYINGVDQGSLSHYAYESQTNYFKWDIPLDTSANQVTTSFRLQIAQSGTIVQPNPMIIHYNYNPSAPPSDEFDIDIDLQEQTLELGEINTLDQTFYIGSSSNRIIKNYFTYSATSCTIEDLQRNYVKVKFNKNFLDDSEIYLSGYALKDTTESEFNTYVRFNFTYIDSLQAFIQTYDYQNGNMLSGVNMSIYEVIESDNALELGDLIYSSSNSESQTILMLKQDTEYFIKNELTGYYAVKNENIVSLDNRYGYLWNPSLVNPLRLYYSKLEPSAQYNANFIVQDVNNNGIAGVTVTMDNSITKISNSIGGLTFNNVSAGTHTFTFVKNGYQSAQRTIDIQLQYAAFTQTLFKDDQIIQPTVSPTTYPTTYPTISPSDQPTLSPIDKPSNIMESVSFGFAKIFGVKTVENANYIFALMLILFPAVIAGGITRQALGFIAGGMIGFVFALAVGLIPIWVFFAMCLLAVIYFVLKGGNEGF